MKLCMRLVPCCVELHYGTLCSFFYQSLRGLKGNVVEERPPKQPQMAIQHLPNRKTAKTRTRILPSQKLMSTYLRHDHPWHLTIYPRTEIIFLLIFFFHSKVDFSLLSLGKAGLIFSLKVPLLVRGLFPFQVRDISRFFDLVTCCEGWSEDQETAEISGYSLSYAWSG